MEGYRDLGEDDWGGGDSEEEPEKRPKKKGSKVKEEEGKAGAKGECRTSVLAGQDMAVHLWWSMCGIVKWWACTRHLGSEPLAGCKHPLGCLFLV